MPSVSTLPLAEIPTLTLLYKLRHLTAAEDESKYQFNAKFNDLLSLIQYDITSLEVSAIVNAANRQLRGGGGVDGAIHARAGPKLLRECKTLGGCETGSAKITKAYELPCDHVIHAVGPIYSKVQRPAELLRGCYQTALELAIKNGCKSIAFSCISTGVYGYPQSKAAAVVLQLMRDWMEAKEKEDFGGIERVIFCCFNEEDENVYQHLIPLYFPPSQARSKKDELKEAAELEKTLPDPPRGGPTEPGQPESKRQKTDEFSDDWEEVDKPDESAINGIEDREYQTSEDASDSKSPKNKDKASVADEKPQEQPIHGLQKDW